MTLASEIRMPALTARSTVMRACALAAFALHMTASFAAEVPGPWGTYLKPFSDQSPWNARPVAPVQGDFEIPRSTYFPTAAQGKYSTGVFLASESDRPMEVMPLPGKPGVWDPDAESFCPGITIARWPIDVLPASGSDGHADIVDPAAGVVHSFFKLKNINGRWCGWQYAWTRIDGRIPERALIMLPPDLDSASLRFLLLAPGRQSVFDSGELEDGGSADFEWPAGATSSAVIVWSGGRDQPSSVGGTLTELAPTREGTR